VPALTGDPTDLSRQTQAQAGTGQPPTTLLTQDVVTGNGARVTPDDTVVQVRYTGTLYADGTVFDSSWKRGPAPVDFPLANVVPGFAQGVAGMRQGGRRVIVIPPALGYGPSADGPIPGGSTLVFVVDLIGVT
jgi:peptidylprolyl isomerase